MYTRRLESGRVLRSRRDAGDGDTRSCPGVMRWRLPAFAICQGPHEPYSICRPSKTGTQYSWNLHSFSHRKRHPKMEEYHCTSCANERCSASSSIVSPDRGFRGSSRTAENLDRTRENHHLAGNHSTPPQPHCTHYSLRSCLLALVTRRTTLHEECIAAAAQGMALCLCRVSHEPPHRASRLAG